MAIDGDEQVVAASLREPVLGGKSDECSLGEGISRFVMNLENVVGRTFLTYLGITYFGLKGVCYALLMAVMLPYFQLMGVTGANYQLAMVVARVPWSMKGWVGVLSDCLPLGRYHKRGYLLLASVVGFLAFGALAAVRPQVLGPGRLWPIAVLFCMAHVLIATFDLLCEGKYSELMRTHRGGSEVLTLVWGCVQAGALVAAVLLGAVVDWAGPRPLMAVCLPVALLAFWRTAAGDLPELPARSWPTLRSKVASEPKLFFLAGVMAAGGLAVALSAALLGTVGRAAVALTTSGVLVAYSFKSLPQVLARSNLYMFLISAAYFDLTGPLAYFYTGGYGCAQDAPHFSYSYYLAVSSVVGSFGAGLGAVLFQYMQHWQFRSAMVVTTFIQVYASVFDVVIITRWNLAYGIPDKAMYLFGDAACQSMAAMMAQMPQAMLTARLCPRGAEATVFAILAGFQNFGASVGAIFGIQLAAWLGVEASAEGPCDFRRLTPLVCVAHGLVPLMVVPLIWLLVPAARMDDESAFEAVSPPPSFCSPASSPGVSPATSPVIRPYSSEDEYYLSMRERAPEELSLPPSLGSPSTSLVVTWAQPDANPPDEYCLMQDHGNGSMSVCFGDERLAPTPGPTPGPEG